MGTRWLPAVFLGLQVLLLLLDLTDRYFDRRHRSMDDHLHWRTLSLLLIVTFVFSTIQYLGLTLIPKADELLAATRQYAGGIFKSRPQAQILAGWPFLAVSVASYYIAGLWDYLIHRFVSHCRPFWFTHEYHHLPNQVFIAMPGILARPFAAFPGFLTALATSISVYGVFYLLGCPFWDITPVVIPVLFAIGMVLTASHSCFLRRWRVLHHAAKWFGLTTPHEHLLHHTVEMNANFGNFTTIWDRLFGTYADPMKQQTLPLSFGLPYDQDFAGTLTLGYVKLPAIIRESCQVARYCNIADANKSEACDMREPKLE